MKISIEITLSPLQENFEIPIINFIKKLRESKFKVIENPLSTQIYGDYDSLMPFLFDQIKNTLELIDKGLLYIKIVKTDRSEYVPNF